MVVKMAASYENIFCLSKDSKENKKKGSRALVRPLTLQDYFVSLMQYSFATYGRTRPSFKYILNGKEGEWKQSLT